MAAVMRRWMVAACFALMLVLGLGAAPAAAQAAEGSLAAGALAVPPAIPGAVSDNALPAAVKTSPVYHVYNPRTYDHVYTRSKATRNRLADKGWRYQGIAWMAPREGKAFYSLYNPKTKTHRYFSDKAQIARLVKKGWTNQGFAWNSAASSDAAGADGVGSPLALYGLNKAKAKTGTYRFATSRAYADRLVAQGYRLRGAVAYGYRVPAGFQDDKLTYSQLGKPVYHLFRYSNSDHVYTQSKARRNRLIKSGWYYQGVAWMAPAQGTAVHAFYNPKTKLHRYAAAGPEAQRLVKAGYRDQGTAWRSPRGGSLEAKALYGLTRPKAKAGTYQLTLSKAERRAQLKGGWKAVSAFCYGYAVPSGFRDDKAVLQPITGSASFDRRLHGILKSRDSLWSCFQYVSAMSYRAGSKHWSGRYLSNAQVRSYGKDMLDHRSGNCYRFAALFCCLARGLGYDADVRTGWVPSYSAGRAPHGWVEIRENGRTYTYDPDMQHELPGYGWYGATYASAPIVYGSW